MTTANLLFIINFIVRFVKFNIIIIAEVINYFSLKAIAFLIAFVIIINF